MWVIGHPGRGKMFTKKRRPPLGVVRSVFHAVSIDASDLAICNVAAELQSKRFLADEAPSLPLDACADPSSCHCVYKHFDDRRTGCRRDTDDGLPNREHSNNVRHGVGRRITDGYSA